MVMCKGGGFSTLEKKNLQGLFGGSFRSHGVAWLPADLRLKVNAIPPDLALLAFLVFESCILRCHGLRSPS
jgi:hypothetical protein